MSYRFVKITSYYDECLNDYYSRNSIIKDCPYSEQFSYLMSQGFQWADFFSSYLKELGVEAYEIVANAQPLQEAWAREHGVSGTKTDIVFAQVKKIKPTVIFIQDCFRFNYEFVLRLRSEIPSIRIMIGWCAVPYREEDIKLFRLFDFMLTCSEKFHEEFKTLGINTRLMIHGFPDSLLRRITNEAEGMTEMDFVFIGSLLKGKGMHNSRREVIEKLLANQVQLKVFGRIEPFDGTVKLFTKQTAFFFSRAIRNIPVVNQLNSLHLFKKALDWTNLPSKANYPFRLARSVYPPVYGLEMLKALYRSKIGFNMHIDIAGSYAANIRLFEVTGVGSCLVTDWKSNLKSFFEPDTEIVTYQSEDECVEKVRWLLDHDDERKKIAQAGQKRCLRDHTLKKRVYELDQWIRTELKNK